MEVEADTAYAKVMKLNAASPIDDSLTEILENYRVLLNKGK